VTTAPLASDWRGIHSAVFTVGRHVCRFAACGAILNLDPEEIAANIAPFDAIRKVLGAQRYPREGVQSSQPVSSTPGRRGQGIDCPCGKCGATPRQLWEGLLPWRRAHRHACSWPLT